MIYSTKSFLILGVICSASLAACAQWCVPTTIIPYAPSMPGITNVTLNTINRTSSDLENYPNNSYVNTGLSTTLLAGSTYNISITHTIDPSICPDMNLRVWIDYNQDYQLNDAGETAISLDHHAAGTYTGTFTVPSNALLGTTRMRVTAKMSNLGGHTLPDPCDLPHDPLGYHGEIEDYTINISSSTGIDESGSRVSGFEVFPNPVSAESGIQYTLARSSGVTIELFNTLGEKAGVLIHDEFQPAGFHQIQLTALQQYSNGVYMLRLTAGETVKLKRIYVNAPK